MNDLKDLNEQAKTALPVQAPPVQRAGWRTPAAQGDVDGVEPSLRCEDLTGMARQICYGSGGLMT